MISPTYTGDFNAASDFSIDRVQIIQRAKNVYLGHSRPPSSHHADEPEGWRILAAWVSPSAYQNADRRLNLPRIDPGTCDCPAEEVMQWIRNPQSPKRVLCVTGPATVGKTLLQEVVLDRCKKQGIQVSCFFFSYVDPSRNTAKNLASTIAYQLGRSNARLRNLMAAHIQTDPLIFRNTPHDQVKALVVDQIISLRRNEGAPFAQAAILIDGVDECQAEDQNRVFDIIQMLTGDERLPFRVVFTSRPTGPLRRALQLRGSLHGLTRHIPLDDDCTDTDRDVRLMLKQSLCDLQVFPADDILERIAESAFGSVVYAATVIRYVKDREPPPQERWNTIVQWIMSDAEASTCSQDSLYRLYDRILSTAMKEYERKATPREAKRRPFMLLLMACALFPTYKVSPYSNVSRYAQDKVLGLKNRTFEALTKDLHCLVQLETPGPSTHWAPLITFYHESCLHFLENPSLSQHLHVPQVDVDHYLISAFLKYFLINVDKVTPELKDKPAFSLDTRTFLTHMSIYHFATILSPREGKPDKKLISKIFPSIREFTKGDGWGKVFPWLELAHKKRAVPTATLIASRLLEALDALVQHDTGIRELIAWGPGYGFSASRIKNPMQELRSQLAGTFDL